MLPASNKGVGMNMGFPDVCLTPSGPATVPVPYPNLAMNAMASPFLSTILLSGMPALNTSAKISMTMGHSPGVANPSYMQKGEYTTGNQVVMLQGNPAVNLTCQTTGNNQNNSVGIVAVPSVTNVFFSRAQGPRAAGGAGGAGAWSRAELRAVIDAMSLDGHGSAGPLVEIALLAGGVAHVRVRAFAAGIASQVYAGLAQAGGAAALIVDVRGNRGGELGAFLALAAAFLPRGSEIVTVIDGDGDAEVHRAQHDPLYAAPVAVLVDRDTASAAELFAGCLQAHRRAAVVGEATAGKATAHVILPHAGGAAYVTAARCLLPGGLDVQGIGVSPDVEVPQEA
jgi:carboxyl-terminal processing protease